MPVHYPTSYYGPSLGNNYNNVVTRRLAIRDRIAFAQSTRFGGQWMEPKGNLVPWWGMIQDAVVACQQMIQELNLAAPLLPDLGIPVILSSVGVATNALTAANGVAVSYVGGVTTTVAGASFVTFDGVGISTGLRVLYYGLTTASLNGVYTVQGVGNTYFLQRSNDMTYWWQFVKPKAYLATSGTNNKANVYSLQTDAWEAGEAFTLALGTSATLTSAGVAGTSLTFTLTNYSPVMPSGINTNLGAGAGNTSEIYPAYNPNLVLNTGEYDFLSQASMAEFTYLKNRAHRMAYRIFKLRENYTPSVSSYGNLIVLPIGSANTANNIGVSTLNDLPNASKTQSSRYPSSFNRGF